MNKDTILAIIVGFGLGLLVAFSFVSLPSFLKKGFQLQFQLPHLSFLSFQKGTPSSSIPSTAPPTSKLVITGPESGSISASNKITLTGNTKPGNTIIVNTNLEDKVLPASPNGSFQIDLKLSEGINDISVSSYQNSETPPDSQDINISYTPEKF